MTDHDAAFLWETEALRSSPRYGSERPGDERWLTLRDAHERTAIPVETLRKWARRNHVASRLETTEFGERRFVLFDDVLDRARALGRDVVPGANPAERRAAANAPAVRGDAVTEEPVPEDASRPEAPAGAAAPVAGTPEIPGGDTTGGSSGPEAMGATESEEAAPPPGTMIVPIAAWDKMLMQLGNLHEAGQQLAEARERAAKAETEATFLRERLAEMRAAGIAEQKASPQAKEEMPAPRQAARYTTPVMGLWEYAATRWRRRRR